jgi:hypothetical protein
MRKHLAASTGLVEYFQYYLQDATLSLDRINYILLSDVLEISVCWSVISIQMWWLHFSNSQLSFY